MLHTAMPLPIVSDRAPTLPTVAKLDALWNEVADRPLWAPSRFFRYLKLRYRFRLEFLSQSEIKTYAPPGKVNDCSNCMENCCIGSKNTVLLGFRDIATLVDINRTDLLTQRKPTFPRDDLAQNPALARMVASRAWAQFPVLAKNEFGACRALDEAGRCTVYPHWPLACARFPYSLYLDPPEIRYSPRCRSFWIHPEKADEAQRMAANAVAGYDERLKDQILLAFASERLSTIGLLKFLSPGPEPVSS